MVCRNCNFQNNEGSFCANCGAPLYQNTANQQYGQYYQNNTSQMYGQYSQNNTSQMYGQYSQGGAQMYNQYPPTNTGYPVNNPFPMKWYNWLIYFALFFSAFMNLSGILYMNGEIYSFITAGLATADDVYLMYGSGLKVLDVLYGTAMFCMIPLNIVTRQKLAHFKKDAPTYVYLTYGIPLAMSVIYTLLSSVITGNFDMDFSSLAMSAAMFVANNKYFERRRSLFRN